MVYMINEQIPERRSCLSTFRDMYLEVIECLQQVNVSIYGLPAIVFIASNFANVIITVYSDMLFPRKFVNDPYLVYASMWFYVRTVNILTLYKIGDVTENEVFI